MKTFFRKTRHKYHAVRTEINGIRFDSKKEARRYMELKALAKIGLISDLDLQPVFVLQEGFERQDGKVRAIKYVADFMYLDKEGNRIVEDTKGIETETFKLKKKMFWLRFPEIDLRIL